MAIRCINCVCKWLILQPACWSHWAHGCAPSPFLQWGLLLSSPALFSLISAGPSGQELTQAGLTQAEQCWTPDGLCLRAEATHERQWDEGLGRGQHLVHEQGLGEQQVTSRGRAQREAQREEMWLGTFQVPQNLCPQLSLILDTAAGKGLSYSHGRAGAACSGAATSISHPTFGTHPTNGTRLSTPRLGRQKH